uniref:Uncharacterized protein n=1 Tax=Solanum tuberosum TaxID=4113 RepID=M1DT63_SOLTU
MSRSVSRSTFPSITPNAGKSFGSEYQAWWKKTHGKFLDDHLQALVDIARPIPVVHLEGSGKVCKNKVLNIGMPSSLGAKENNIATPQREKSQDSGEYLSCSYLMKPPPVTQVKKRLPYVSCDEVKDDLGKELFAAGERLTNAMFEEQDKVEEVSSIRQSLDNMKKEIRVLCKRTQDLKVLLTAVEDEVDGAKLATLFAVKEFDACSDTDLTNGLGQNKEHLEAMRQELINDKLCLD